MNIESYANEKYLVLNYFYTRQESFKDVMIVKTNLQSIADELHFRKMKAQELVNELVDDGMLLKYTLKGKYQLTDKGIKLVEIFKDTII